MSPFACSKNKLSAGARFVSQNFFLECGSGDAASAAELPPQNEQRPFLVVHALNAPCASLISILANASRSLPRGQIAVPFLITKIDMIHVSEIHEAILLLLLFLL
jgi:hypothetical protein